MLNKMNGLKNLTGDIIQRLDDCDELSLLRAFRKMANTEIAAVLSVLPMQYVNQVLIILPADISNRVIACGFATRKLTPGIMKKLLVAIDYEAETAAAQKARKENKADRLVVQRQDTPEVPIAGHVPAAGGSLTEQKPFDDFSDDKVSARSLAILDTLGKLLGNTFRKH
jgi:hypothetical protein